MCIIIIIIIWILSVFFYTYYFKNKIHLLKIDKINYFLRRKCTEI